MNYSGIKINFNATNPDNFMKLSKNFLNTFFGFLNSIGTNEITINDTVRTDGSSHSTGDAIDLHEIKTYSNIYTFHYQNPNFNKDKSKQFFNTVFSNLGKSLKTYYSPTDMYVNGKRRDNDKKSELDVQHLNHLHIQLEKNSTFEKTGIGIGSVVIVSGILYYGWKKKLWKKI